MPEEIVWDGLYETANSVDIPVVQEYTACKMVISIDEGERMKRLTRFSLMACMVMILFSAYAFCQDPDAGETQDLRVKKCVSCCTSQKLICYNLNPDRRLCEAEYENCFTTCKTRGATPSEWGSDCWAEAVQ